MSERAPTEADAILRHMLKCGPLEMPNPALAAFVHEVAELVDVANTDPNFPNYAPPFERRLRSTQTIALAVVTWRRLREIADATLAGYFADYNARPEVVPVPGVAKLNTDNTIHPSDPHVVGGCPKCAGGNDTFIEDEPFGAPHAPPAFDPPTDFSITTQPNAGDLQSPRVTRPYQGGK